MPKPFTREEVEVPVSSVFVVVARGERGSISTVVDRGQRYSRYLAIRNTAFQAYILRVGNYPCASSIL